MKKTLMLPFLIWSAGLVATADETRPLHLSLDEAIAMALEKNADVVVERESLAIANANVLRTEAAYDPMLRGEARFRDRTDPVNSILSGAPAGEVAPSVTSAQASASVVRLLPTGGTVFLFSSLSRDETNSVLALLTPSWSAALGAELRQPLLQNRKIDPVRRAIRIARIDRTRAESSLERIASEVTAAVERAYWSVVAARRDVAIRKSSVTIAEKHREDTRVRIAAGTQPEAEQSVATAEVERRRAELLSSRENLARAENALRNLTVRDASDATWDRPIVPSSEPQAEAVAIDRATAIQRAIASRPEIREAERRLERQDVEIEAALDRVKPQVDLVASYSGRGLAGSENEDALPIFGRPVDAPEILEGNLGRSVGTLGENRFPDASLGVAVSLPLRNRAAKEEAAIASAIRRQIAAALDQARQRVALEVRNAFVALESAEQRVAATRAARAAAEAQLDAERARHEAGTTQSFFLLTRQNDLTAAQSAEIVALTDYEKALTELARATGTLLTQRGIELPDESYGRPEGRP